jgi:hypothetical protein
MGLGSWLPLNFLSGFFVGFGKKSPKLWGFGGLEGGRVIYMQVIKSIVLYVYTYHDIFFVEHLYKKNKYIF